MSVPAGRTLESLAAKDVRVIGGVGPKQAKSLAEMEIRNVLDLVTHYPRRYLDRTRRSSVAEMQVGEEAWVLARVRKVSARRTRSGRGFVVAEVSDGSAYLQCTFFNQPWRSKQLSEGQEVVVFGRLDSFRGRRQMTNPVVDLVGDRTGRIVPVYPQSAAAGLTTWQIGRWVDEALERAGGFADPLPRTLRERLDLVERTVALREIHLPSSWQAKDAARRRLAFDELLRLQAVVVMRKHAELARSAGIAHVVDPGEGRDLVRAFLAGLAFEPTCAQRRAIDLLKTDLADAAPMHRLLQGDVGSGKTVVAVAALLVAVQGGHQGALMAPTEVLAEQHHMGVRELVAGLSVADGSTLLGERPVRVELLTSRTLGAERASLRESLLSGEVDIVVGTHALLTEDVGFASLGVVVVDEQHRFGVEHRAALRAKGNVQPDTLVMTATPIPRTVAMTMFGDLDTAVLDELPAGRLPVTTASARGELAEQEAWQRVRDEVAQGRQAYVVCPLVEGSEKVQARSATEEKERLEKGVLCGLSLSLMHGQMPAADKQEVMEAFRRGETSVLVATTVIEVGVDVSDATVMVVEDADRFGIAQLHQLRGRVGRGSDPSWCYLLSRSPSPESQARLEAVEASTDGFELAEVDLDMRGEGSVLGTRQQGVSDLKIASIRRDRDLLERARSVAEEVLALDPRLSHHRLLADEIRFVVADEDREFLFKS